MEGRVLAGRFRLVEMLGQGGMGSVWRARHLELDTDVAVKLMDPSLTTHAEGLARFRREAQAAASLKSANVVQVFDYGVDGDTPYIAMEMLQGESLAKRLERMQRLTIAATATILVQVARAVGKAHDAGIVHRDLKPENIFLVFDEDVEIAKVLDFGIAKRTSGPGGSMTGAVQTQTGAMLGTPYYMSPEQAAGKKDVDHLTDIWSFGVIACECLTGRRLFDADSLGGLVLAICTEPMPLPSVLGPVPPEFDQWFSRCVSRDRQARFQTIREAASALDAIGRRYADGTSHGAAIPVASGIALAATAPSQWQSSASILGDTRAGPTAITLSNSGNSNRKRLFGLGAVAVVIVVCAGLFFLSKQSTHVATMASSSAGTSALGAERSPVLAAATTPVLPQAATGPAASTATSATSAPMSALPIPTKLKSPGAKHHPGSNTSTVPAAAPARSTQRSNAVDLAF